ncbi:uncharacterized protein J8A68_003248 [[Candida] subhashii]|uniref:Large ribosomal subunit protein uL30m n=1 Tax=[Candida] subhashii TaxID=561895 RepID=A0A8J5QMW0_9ASCO|nr:uncharacterized protein J8A68_003248 [[Candida] subhashii]KAG7663248.1 hypothetical protein J8A68_003248 [[Candida] subhashii]
MSSIDAAKQLFFKITQHRSVIGMPRKLRRTVRSLGLNHRDVTVYQTISPSTAVKLSKVKELVKVELADQKLSRREVNLTRKYKPGFSVVKSDA